MTAPFDAVTLTEGERAVLMDAVDRGVRVGRWIEQLASCQDDRQVISALDCIAEAAVVILVGFHGTLIVRSLDEDEAELLLEMLDIHDGPAGSLLWSRHRGPASTPPTWPLLLL
ncbi:hypothetical protein ACH4TQ_49380 [Streptomyces sp. NPDC021218]|uniref:hypothetical protein n=1 Tax=unclassified Streptomyces TaxID=2593676 RepID=UPI00367598E5